MGEGAGLPSPLPLGENDVILQVVTTFVDEENAESEMWDIDVTDAELAIIRQVIENGIPDPREGDEILVFRGKEFTVEFNDYADLLSEVGKKIEANETINKYVY